MLQLVLDEDQWCASVEGSFVSCLEPVFSKVKNPTPL